MSARKRRIKVKDIPGLEGRYEITINGDVYSKARHINVLSHAGTWYKRFVPARKIKRRTNGIELHQFVDVTKILPGGGRYKTVIYPHKIMAELWIPKTSEKQQYVTFVNGDYTDLQLKNLKWITQRELYDMQVKKGRKEKLDLFKSSSLWQKNHERVEKLVNLLKQSAKDDILYFRPCDRQQLYTAAKKAGVIISTHAYKDELTVTIKSHTLIYIPKH